MSDEEKRRLAEGLQALLARVQAGVQEIGVKSPQLPTGRTGLPVENPPASGGATFCTTGNPPEKPAVSAAFNPEKREA